MLRCRTSTGRLRTLSRYPPPIIHPSTGLLIKSEEILMTLFLRQKTLRFPKTTSILFKTKAENLRAMHLMAWFVTKQ